MPTVSFIMATYNRSELLPYSIGSVRWQSHADWELIVVADGCTDDTVSVVSAMAADDPRIRLVARHENSGEQSTANNAGLAEARGQFIAFLNHDDLWLPDHLERALAAIDRLAADMVYSLPITVAYPDGTLRFHSTNAEMRYHPSQLVPASYWLSRRTLFDELGTWRLAREIWAYPSQDLLFRWWNARRRLCGHPELTCLAFPSGNRPGAYSRRDASEIALWHGRIRDEPDFREKLLARMVLTQGREDSRLWRSLWRVVREWVRGRWCEFLAGRGIEPRAVQFFLRYGRKGGWFAPLRQSRGLPPLQR
jgi:glycosyltransferase involved in cell wall biosynthesis